VTHRHYRVQQLPHPLVQLLGALVVPQQLEASATPWLPEQQEQSVQTHAAPWQHPQHWQVWQSHEPLATTGLVGARAIAAQSRKLVMGKVPWKSENRKQSVPPHHAGAYLTEPAGSRKIHGDSPHSHR